MSEIQVYQFPDTGGQIRTIDRDGEPWFVAADVCATLGIVNAGSALMRLDEDERDSIRLTDGTPGNPTKGIVNEAGLYSLILRSDKPAAKAFKRWITHEVLPSIRKSGRYEATPAPQLDELEVARRYVAALEDKKALQARVAELEPEAARARKTMDADGLSLVGTVAKRFGIKERTLREFLYAEKLLIRDGVRRNEPYATLVQSGHFELKTRPVEIDPDGPPTMKATTYVTPKGEALIWKRLHDSGLVQSPVMPAQQLELVMV